MTQPELMKLLKMIDIDYPSNKLAQDKELQDMTVARWMQKLEQYDAMIVYAAYETHVTRSPSFAPNWQHLTQIIADAIVTDRIPAEQAWGKIQAAIRKYGHTMKDEAKQALGEVWDIVDRFGWEYFCQMPIEESSTYFAQFRNAYDADGRKITEMARLSPAVKQILSGIKQLGDGK